MIRSLPFVLAVCLFGTASNARSDETAVAAPATEEQAAGNESKWKPLFNGKDLDGWKPTQFGGEGEVRVEDGIVVIDPGVDLSGISSTRTDWPTADYEVEFEAQRAQGSDFFVGLTFPVEKSHCSLILGGWGGGMCGLSSIDGMDASENETTSYEAFTNGQWYRIRVRVTKDRIQAWLDRKMLVDVETTDRRIDVRFEVEPSKPFGFATFQSMAKIRNARIRTLPAAAEDSSPKASK